MKLFALFKKEAVLCIAAICALLTMLAVPPDSAYAGYIDMRMLCLLFSLMAVVALVGRCGAFRFLAVWLLQRLQLVITKDMVQQSALLRFFTEHAPMDWFTSL